MVDDAPFIRSPQRLNGTGGIIFYAQILEGMDVDVMQSGYVIGDRCLRPALVAVAKGGAKAAKPHSDGNGAAPRKAANDDFPDGEQPGD